MGSGSILDSNIVIYYLKGALDLSAKVVVERAIMAGAKLSVISKIELLCWNPPSGSDFGKIQSFVHDSIIFGLDDVIVENTVKLRKNYRKIKVPDAIIAATALSLDFALITRNTSDFSLITALKIIDPFDA